MIEKEIEVAEGIRKMSREDIADVLDEFRCHICAKTLEIVLTPIVRCYSEQRDYCRALGIDFVNITSRDVNKIWVYVYVAHIQEKIPQKVVHF